MRIYFDKIFFYPDKNIKSNLKNILKLSIRTELHCHNLFSNFHLGNNEPPYDCNVTIRDQLECAYDLNLDSLFVTNHNTLDGYSQMVKYRNEHNKFKNIQIYPAEEITIDTGAHVLAYGIHKAIPVGLPFLEVIDEIKKQDGVSSAPHPFSLVDALREKSKFCDMIEVFNSNNIDVISNAKAYQFAIENNMIKVSGSDSHVSSTLGRCVNIIESENNMDDILFSLKHNKIKILNTGYTLPDETLDHIKFKINNSKDYIFDYISEHHPNAVGLFSFLLKAYEFNPDSYIWKIFYKFCLYFLKRISNKINYQNLDYNFMNERNPLVIFRKAF